MTERNWTSAQQEAIEKKGAHLLVSAGAGSGKTAVLIERIVRKITDPDDPVNIDQLLIVTFTNAAAEEMRQRLAAALHGLLEKEPGNKGLLKQAGLLDQAHITTLHSFCLDLMRKNFYRLGLDASFRVAGDLERQLIYEDTLDHYLEEQYEKEDALLPLLADCYGGNIDDRGLNSLIYEIYDFSLSQPDPEKWLEEAAHNFTADSLEAYPWSGFWLEEIKNSLIEMASKLKEARESDCFPEIPQAWQEQFLFEEEELKNMALWDGSLSALMDRLYDHSFQRLSSSKSDPGDKAAKEYCRKYRETVKSLFNKAKKQFFPRRAEALLNDLKSLSVLMSGLKGLVSGYAQALDREKRRRNLVDYGDMEHFCLRLLEDEENGVREQLRKDFQEVLVDEYQDINGVQNRILELVARDDNLFMVGDIKQSIYGFRLAEPALFLEKYYQYREGLGGAEIDLSANFRSTGAVIAAVNFIFSQLMSKELAGIDYDESAMLKAARVEIGPSPEVYLLNYLTLKDKEKRLGQKEEEESRSTEDDSGDEESDSSVEEHAKIRREARFIAAKIWQTVEEGYQFRDIAVLLRSVKNKEDVMVEELSRADIPVAGGDRGGSPTFAEVDLLLSILEIIDNPLQDIPLAAVIYSPLVGIGPDMLLTLERKAYPSLYHALTAFIAKADEEEKEDRKKAALFLEKLEQWRQKSRGVPVSELINIIYRDTGLDYLAQALPGGKYRRNNLLDFYELARSYDENFFKGLFRFICFIRDLQDKGGEIVGGRSLCEDENVVRVTSIHKSKGLEYPVVILAGLGDAFNLRPKNSDMVFDREFFWGPKIAFRKERVKYPTLAYQAINYHKRKKALSEEMRILYVALTRAKEKLIMTASVRRLDEAVKKWSLTAATTDEETKLPARVIREDLRYIDWLGRALIRHPGAQVLRQMVEEENTVAVLANDSAFKIEVVDADIPVASEKAATSVLETAANGEDNDMVIKDRKLHIKEILSYVYPYREIADFPAKWTVTEVQKLAYGHEYLEDSFIYVNEDGQQNKKSDPVHRGNVYHLILEHLNLQKTESEGEIRSQIKDFADRGIIDAEALALIDPAVICRFFASPLGIRVRQAKSAEREIKFTYALPATELNKNVAIDDKVILQGMIDLAFLEKGGWVIVDYKTGGRHLNEKELKNKYASQVDYYCRALSAIYQNPVKEAYLYMLDDGRLIAVKNQAL